jgi:hypothetical protein
MKGKRAKLAKSKQVGKTFDINNIIYETKIYNVYYIIKHEGWSFYNNLLLEGQTDTHTDRQKYKQKNKEDFLVILRRLQEIAFILDTFWKPPT